MLKIAEAKARFGVESDWLREKPIAKTAVAEITIRHSELQA
jgi:hypothetical protein